MNRDNSNEEAAAGTPPVVHRKENVFLVVHLTSFRTLQVDGVHATLDGAKKAAERLHAIDGSGVFVIQAPFAIHS